MGENSPGIFLNMQLFRYYNIIFLSLFLALSSLHAETDSTASDSWAQWRGIQRDGISRENGLLQKWPAAGPSIVWRKALGEGYSAISIAAGKAYTMFDAGADEFAVCLNAASGEEIWRFRTDKKFRNSWGNGPRATPQIENGIVYLASAHGKLYALNANNGQQIWMVDIPAEFNGEVPDLGYSNTPLIYGDLLLVTGCGGSNESILALEKKTAKLRWAAQSDHPGYSSPVLMPVDGIEQAIFFTGSKISGISPKNGQVLWEYTWRTDSYENVATPVILPGNRVFFSSPHPVEKGSAVLEIVRDGEAFFARAVWRNNNMKNHFSSTIYHKGFLYGTDRSILRCINAETGEVRWSQRGFGEGTLMMADNKLVVLGTRGKLALVDASPEAYREISSMQLLSGKCYTAPSLSNGKLYLRNQKEIIALDLREN